MTPAAAPASAIMLWHPARRAYLAASGKGFVRKVENAAVMTSAKADEVLSAHWPGEMEAKATVSPINFPPRPARDTLAGADDNELLRRAVRGLCARDRTGAPHWALVMDALGLTSGAAVMLCRRLNIDPNKRTGH